MGLRLVCSPKAFLTFAFICYSTESKGVEQDKHTPAKIRLARRIHNMILAMINTTLLTSNQHRSLPSHQAEENEKLMSSRICGRLDDKVQRSPRTGELVNGPSSLAKTYSPPSLYIIVLDPVDKNKGQSALAL